jgi:hypothetical protein
MGCRVSVGEKKTAGQRIISAHHAHRRMADSGKRRGGSAKPKAARATEVGEDSRVGRSGRVGRMPLGPAWRENKKRDGLQE